MSILSLIHVGPRYNSADHEQVIREGGKSPAQWEQFRKISVDRHNAAIENYREAMEGVGWVTKLWLEIYFNYGHGSCNTMLRRLEDEGFIEKRPLGDKPFHRNRGWEYRWKEK